jgi:hypothetical protein
MLLPLTARAAAAIEAVEVEPSDPQWAYIGGQTGQTPRDDLFTDIHTGSYVLHTTVA